MACNHWMAVVVQVIFIRRGCIAKVWYRLGVDFCRFCEKRDQVSVILFDITSHSMGRRGRANDRFDR